MNVALTSWNERISPVFDSARSLLIVEIEDGEVTSSSIAPFNPAVVSHLTELLSSLKIDVLICGAISEIPANIIEASGIELIPFVSGRIEDVVRAYAEGKAVVPSFLMPGCGHRHRRNIRGKHFKDRVEEVRTVPKRDGTSSQNQGGGGGCGNKGARGSGSGSGQGCGNNSGQGQGCGNSSGQGRGGQGKGQGCGGGGKGQGCGTKK